MLEQFGFEFVLIRYHALPTMLAFCISYEFAPLQHAGVNEIAAHYPPKACCRSQWGVLPSGRMLTANTVIGKISDKLTAQDYNTAQSVSLG
jgi:hypothetical protein